MRTVFAVLTCCVLTLAIWTAPVAASDTFEVRGIAVDVTAETAAAARTQALAEGERTALDRLLRRLTMQVDHDRLPKPSATGLAALVRDFDVAEERTSAVRYLARLNYRFNEAGVRDLLRNHGVPFAETRSKAVLVLPVHQSAGATVLWDDPNPWRAAWEALPPRDGLVPLVLPLGDLSDIRAIGAAQAADGDTVRLRAIGGRYGASDTLVAVARSGIDIATNRPRLEVFVTRHGSLPMAETTVLTLNAQADETDTQFLGRAALAVAALAEDQWKRDNLIQFGRPAILPVRIPVRGLGDWIEAQRRLGSVALISKTELVLLSTTEVRVNLHYLGDPGRLRLALAQADLALESDEYGWTVHPAGPRGGAE